MARKYIIFLFFSFTVINSYAQSGKISGIDTVQKLKEVTISGVVSKNQEPVNIGKIAIKPMDLPQSVMIIDRELLERQQVTQVSDILKNANGVYQMGNTGGVQEEIAARGFAFSSSNTFKNGIRFNNGIKPEVSALERVEILKGSSAILYGNVAAGGILNFVTKKPQFEKGGEVGMRVGSFDFMKPTIDVYGAVNGSEHVAYRLNGSYERAGSFRDKVWSDRAYINPSFLIKAGKKLEILIEGDYLKDNRTLDYGTGAVNYVIANIPRNRFLGAPWSYNKTEQMSSTMTTTYQLGKNWKITNVTGIQSYNNDLFGTTRPNASGIMVADDGTFARGVQRTKIDEQYYLSQLDLTGEITTGTLKHQILVGVDADKYNTNTIAYKGIAYDTINIYDLNKKKQRTDIPSLNPATYTDAPLKRFGAYAQDLVSVAEKIKVLIGARFTYLESRSNVKTVAPAGTVHTAYYDNAVTPRIGLVYQPSKKMSVFASYANSFVLNTGYDANYKALPPSYVDQYELGVKNDLLNGALSANVTVYQIVNHNLAQAVIGTTNTLMKELGGEITSTGGELDIVSKPYHGFSIIGGYSYNETKYTKSNTYKVGSLLRYNPNHTANLGIYYTANRNSKLKGLGAGLNVTYIGERVAGRSTRYIVNGTQVNNDAYKLMPLPAFTLFDASVGYTYKDVSVRLKVNNIFNVLSYQVHDDNSVNPIAPTQFLGTISYKL